MGYNLWGCGRHSATRMTQGSHVDSCRASPTLGLGRAGDWGWNVGGTQSHSLQGCDLQVRDLAGRRLGEGCGGRDTWASFCAFPLTW